MAREAISKKLRFDVFNRDGFKCQYCGRSTPDVVLEIDHILPVVEGGKNELINLVTSCFDCNRGKGKSLIGGKALKEKQNAELEILQIKKEQLEMYFKYRESLLTVNNIIFEKVDEMLDIKNKHLSEIGKQTVTNLVRDFGVDEFFISLEIALEYDRDDFIDYAKRILFSRRKARQNPIHKDKTHIINTAKKMFGELYPSVYKTVIEALELGYEKDFIFTILYNSRNISSFVNELKEAIEGE